MPILHLFIRLIATTLYFCLAAIVKSYETNLIERLKMDRLTRLVFDLLHAALLAAFSVELLNLLWKDVRSDLRGESDTLKDPVLSLLLIAHTKLRNLPAFLKQSAKKLSLRLRTLRHTKEPTV